MNSKEAVKIFNDCINEMYENSTPSITWQKVQKKYDKKRLTNRILLKLGFERNCYNKHSIFIKDYDRIKDKYSKKLNVYYRKGLDWFLLDYAPKFKE